MTTFLEAIGVYQIWDLLIVLPVIAENPEDMELLLSELSEASKQMRLEINMSFATTTSIREMSLSKEE